MHALSSPPGSPEPAGWTVVLTEQAEAWYMRLTDEDANRIAASLDELGRQGPTLGRVTAYRRPDRHP